ncbi:hypothetical protein [Amycolatopsis sp. CA-230715]|uniref:hypothetical protein n=1 Tax=Amycolatopsis sp. CA-230715 TaxID=2745196 RepID=UPI001C00C62A|nr:hypothetical protein [Amycolatopsis sp. CA-230715]
MNQRVDVVGPHWVLDRRHHSIERNARYGRGNRGSQRETTHEEHYVVLLPDGTLKKVAVWNEEVVTIDDGSVYQFETPDHSIRSVYESDVEDMDFEKHYASHGNPGDSIVTWGDQRVRGRRLLVHAKGVGLSQALKRLL